MLISIFYLINCQIPENGDIPSAIAELETGKFVLKHIEDKYKFNFQNIF